MVFAVEPGGHDGDAGVVEGRGRARGARSCRTRETSARRIGRRRRWCRRAQGMVTFLRSTVKPSGPCRPTRSTSWGRSAALIRSVRRVARCRRPRPARPPGATMTPVSMPSSTTKRVAAGDLDAVVEGVPRAPWIAGERRQQGVVAVDVRGRRTEARKRPDELEESRGDDQVRVVRRRRLGRAPRPRPLGPRGRARGTRRWGYPARSARASPSIPSRSAPTAATRTP